MLVTEKSPCILCFQKPYSVWKKYASVQMELLAIVFACEKYYNFINGHNIIMQNYHKPLTWIIKKPLGKVTTEIQRNILKLFKHLIDIIYLRGKDMFLADTLSRTFIKDDLLYDPDRLCTLHSVFKNLTMSYYRIKQLKMHYTGMKN